MHYRFLNQGDITALRLEYFHETTNRVLPDEILLNTIRYLEEELALTDVGAVQGERIAAVGLLSVFAIMPTVHNLLPSPPMPRPILFIPFYPLWTTTSNMALPLWIIPTALAL